MSYLYGCDPELFVHDGENFVPAHNMIPGTKDAPHKVRNGAVQVDGLALEFNIDPVDNGKDWLHRIRDVQGQLRDMIDPKYNLKATPSADFVEKDFINLPPEAKVLGCDPDLNAWSGYRNEVPGNAGENPYRCAGGHVHIGWREADSANLTDQVHIEDCRTVVKALDATLGALSINFDKDRRRAALYGKAGAHRVKPYGVEYRTLSNAWLETDERVNWVFETTKLTLEILERGDGFFNQIPDYTIQNANNLRDQYYLRGFEDKLLRAGFKRVA